MKSQGTEGCEKITRCGGLEETSAKFTFPYNMNPEVFAVQSTLPLPVSHRLHRVKAVAHVQRSDVANVGNAQVELESCFFGPFHFCWHMNSNVLSLLYRSQIFQQIGGFLLARAEKNSDSSPG